jgi:hypothetical protein
MQALAFTPPDATGRKRTLAQAGLHQLGLLLAPGCVPLCVSDGDSQYLPVIVTHCGCRVSVPGQQATGSAPKPRWMPLPQLGEAQGSKTVHRWRLGCVSHPFNSRARTMRPNFLPRCYFCL